VRDRLSYLLLALAHPTRREILRRLSSRPVLHWSLLVQGFDSSRQAVARHIQVLESAELITDEPEPDLHLYELRAEALESLLEWLERYRRRIRADKRRNIGELWANIEKDASGEDPLDGG
jgi:DNA-binding transcriptional ArsR family regulator